MSKIIAICGKTHYANKLKEKENAVILSTDEVTYDLIDNEQGKFYDKFCLKVNKYLMKKSVEFVNAGCNIILDWGFWTKELRNEITDYYKTRNITVELHYIDINNEDWEKNIEERNQKVREGEGGSDFYVDEGLKRKLLEKFQKPSKEEVDVWYYFEKDNLES